MANKNGFSSLLGALATAKSDGVNLLKLLSASKASSSVSAGQSSRTLKPGAQSDRKSQSLSTADVVKASIKFGSPSSNKTATTGGSSEWATLLKQTASGGVASALGGGLTSALGGLGGLVSSVAGLFGLVKKTEAPLTLFQLPDSQNQTISIGSKVAGTSQSAGSLSGVYRASSSVASSEAAHSQIYQNQNAQVTQAVKQALLNSSSLNDVIAEI